MPQSRKFSDRQAEKIKVAYEKCPTMTIAILAEELECSESAIRTALKRAGCQMRIPAKRTKFHPSIRAAALKMYRAGASSTAVSIKYGISSSTVRKWGYKGLKEQA